MKKKLVITINIIVLVLVTTAIIYLAPKFLNQEPTIPEGGEDCIDVNNVASMIYDACYDAYTKNILIELRREKDSYNIKGLELSFFDTSEKSYSITEVPAIEGEKAYKISAEKNPENVKIKLDIKKDFSSAICESPRILYVKYCPVGSGQQGVDVGVEKDTLKEEKDYVSVGEGRRQNSDLLEKDLVEKERIWKSQCDSQWNCGSWESCAEGIQKRNCIDTNKCFIPTEIPEFTRFCDGTCVENWQCEWSKCIGGFTTPKCKDLSKCGTSYNVPNKLACIGGATSQRCTPDITCTPWTSCDVEYHFLDLTAGVIKQLNGSTTRTCTDKSQCLQPSYESKSCSTKIDIYTKKIVKCGIDFLGIYNRLDNVLIAKIEQSKSQNNPYINIFINDEGSDYCDYCFDGIKNGDEELTDCGGSCQSCDQKRIRTAYVKPSFMKKIETWFERLIT
jgi:hypothetical protein